MLKVAKAISHSKDPEEVALMTVESIKTAMNVKGCSLFLFNRKTNELELSASFWLSEEYINKGPVSALCSIAQSLEDGSVRYTMLWMIQKSNILKKYREKEVQTQ
jgi:hypothetical protein